MEAPEKLYVDLHDNLNDSFLYGFTERHLGEDIEYTRTDAFIEKACEWIGNYLMDLGYPDDWMRDSQTIPSGERLFRNAMKGE